jgi:glycosyltransferase involved in cell wall biosynthesis
MGMGGADSQLLSAARELLDRGHQVRIISMTPLGPMGLEARDGGIPTDSLEMRRGVPDPRGLARLIRIVRAWKPDVVHSHMVHANLLARALRLFVRVPALVSTIHNINEGGRLRMAAYRWTNSLVDHMTIVSEAASDHFVKHGIVPKRLLTVVANGVDPALFPVAPPEAREAFRRSVGVDRQLVWVAVGRFEEAKDYRNMLRAFARVREHHPDVVLVIVGRGSLQPETEALAESLGLGGSVKFLGVRNDVPAILSAADAYLMSSAWEGMPMVLLEAAAAGLPIVATEVGGNREVVVDEHSGFLVPPRNDAALAAAMLRVVGLPESERRAMGERGRERIRTHFGLSRVVDRWEGLYREVLVRKGFANRVSPTGTSAAVGIDRSGDIAV